MDLYASIAVFVQGFFFLHSFFPPKMASIIALKLLPFSPPTSSYHAPDSILPGGALSELTLSGGVPAGFHDTALRLI